MICLGLGLAACNAQQQQHPKAAPPQSPSPAPSNETAATTPPPPDDDLSVEIAVPMGVSDGAYLTALRNAFPLLPSTGKTVDLGQGVPDPAFPTEQSLLTLALGGTWGIYDFTDAVAAKLNLYFGAQGYFQGRPVHQRKDGKPRVFVAKPDGPPQAGTYFVFQPTTGATPGQYVVDVYDETALGTGEFWHQMSVQFTVHDGQYARVHILWNAPSKSGPGRDLAVIDYDTQTAADTYSLKAAIEVDPPTQEMPLLYAYSETVHANQSIVFQGVNAYRLAVGAPAPGIPRYDAVVPGDMDVFNGAILMDSKTAPKLPVSQNLAFVPVEAAKAVGDHPDQSLFTSHSYGSYMQSALAASLRSSTDPMQLGLTCATAGQALRPGAPSLPTNICATATGVTDAAVATALDAACGTSAAPPAALTAACTQNWSQRLMANPSHLYYDAPTSSTHAVLPGEPTLPEHKTTDQLLQTLQPLDLGAVRNVPWLRVDVKKAADFPDAEPLPVHVKP